MRRLSFVGLAAACAFVAALAVGSAIAPGAQDVADPVAYFRFH